MWGEAGVRDVAIALSLRVGRDGRIVRATRLRFQVEIRARKPMRTNRSAFSYAVQNGVHSRREVNSGRWGQGSVGDVGGCAECTSMTGTFL
jgi:hypothetical protein